jgi:histidinol-phosphate aminotransferase
VKTAADALRFVKPGVRAISAYSLALRRAPVKLNQNENPYDVPEPLKRRVVEQALARPWSRYPEFDPTALLEALAQASGWKSDGILLGNGSNELIEALLRVSVGPGTPVVIPEPSFSLYALLARILGGDVVAVPLGPQLEYDAAELRSVSGGTGAALTIVCSPNNPTGGVLPLEELRRLADEAPGLVVVDEAYHEFAGFSAAPLLAGHPNLIVLRTFSKALSLAGLRVGYLLAAPELVREIAKARLPYSLDFVAQAAALAVLEEPGVLRANVERLVAAREALLHELYRIPGVKPYPSRANFILIELPDADPKAVFESLCERGVLIRDVSGYPRLERCLRATVGTDEENAALVQALRFALEQRRFRRGEP